MTDLNTIVVLLRKGVAVSATSARSCRYAAPLAVTPGKSARRRCCFRCRAAISFIAAAIWRLPFDCCDTTSAVNHRRNFRLSAGGRALRSVAVGVFIAGVGRRRREQKTGEDRRRRWCRWRRTIPRASVLNFELETKIGKKTKIKKKKPRGNKKKTSFFFSTLFKKMDAAQTRDRLRYILLGQTPVTRPPVDIAARLLEMSVEGGALALRDRDELWETYLDQDAVDGLSSLDEWVEAMTDSTHRHNDLRDCFLYTTQEINEINSMTGVNLAQAGMAAIDLQEDDLHRAIEQAYIVEPNEIQEERLERQLVSMMELNYLVRAFSDNIRYATRDIGVGWITAMAKGDLYDNKLRYMLSTVDDMQRVNMLLTLFVVYGANHEAFTHAAEIAFDFWVGSRVTGRTRPSIDAHGLRDALNQYDPTQPKIAAFIWRVEASVASGGLIVTGEEADNITRTLRQSLRNIIRRTIEGKGNPTNQTKRTKPNRSIRTLDPSLISEIVTYVTG